LNLPQFQNVNRLIQQAFPLVSMCLSIIGSLQYLQQKPSNSISAFQKYQDSTRPLFAYEKQRSCILAPIQKVTNISDGLS